MGGLVPGQIAQVWLLYPFENNAQKYRSPFHEPKALERGAAAPLWMIVDGAATLTSRSCTPSRPQAKAARQRRSMAAAPQRFLQVPLENRSTRGDRLRRRATPWKRPWRILPGRLVGNVGRVVSRLRAGPRVRQTGCRGRWSSFRRRW